MSKDLREVREPATGDTRRRAIDRWRDGAERPQQEAASPRPGPRPLWLLWGDVVSEGRGAEVLKKAGFDYLRKWKTFPAVFTPNFSLAFSEEDP